jgi:hypothetical protein
MSDIAKDLRLLGEIGTSGLSSVQCLEMKDFAEVASKLS